MDTRATPVVGSKDTTHLIFLQHYFGGFDYGSDRVADLQIHLFGASSGYDAFDEVLANLNDDVGHDPAELKLRDFARESIPRSKCHSQIIKRGPWPRPRKMNSSGTSQSASAFWPAPKGSTTAHSKVQIQAFAAEAA